MAKEYTLRRAYTKERSKAKHRELQIKAAQNDRRHHVFHLMATKHYINSFLDDLVKVSGWNQIVRNKMLHARKFNLPMSTIV